VEEVYNRPKTAFVATFVGDSNLFFGELVGVSDDGETATMETDLGTFTVSTANLVSEPQAVLGDRMPFAVRPQFLRLVEDDATDNTVDCTVQDVLYQSGTGTQVILSAVDADGDDVELQLKSEERLTVDAERVTVGWDAEHTILLERPSVLADIDLEKDILGQ
jgi:ABC-type Fe3+/spermidine/putrescine transport system ATPase subunit